MSELIEEYQSTKKQFDLHALRMTVFEDNLKMMVKPFLVIYCHHPRGKPYYLCDITKVSIKGTRLWVRFNTNCTMHVNLKIELDLLTDFPSEDEMAERVNQWFNDKQKRNNQ